MPAPACCGCNGKRRQKIGIEAGLKISLVGKIDPTFVADANELGADVSPRLRRESNIILFAADARGKLTKLRELKDSIVSNGAIWVIRPKGSEAITEADVMAAGKAAGLVDTKVVRFSQTHTAEKLVIPITKRK